MRVKRILLKLVEDIPDETFPTHSSNLTGFNYWFSTYQAIVIICVG
jgi:hypothetical protein